MSRWLGLLGAALAAALALSMTGCSPAIDSEGNVVSDRVWFDQAGGAHCPKCDTLQAWAARRSEEIKTGKKAEEDPPSLVKPHQSVCSQDAKHSVTWAADDVLCAKCSGSGLCPDCRGAGITASGKPCGGCVGFDEDSRPVGTGRCMQCRGKGTIRYGGTGDFGT